MRSYLIGFVAVVMALTLCSCKKTVKTVTSEVEATVAETENQNASGADITWAKELFGEKLIRRDKSEVSVDELQGKKRVAIYFSAHWCPPCRSFTPVLVEVYNKLKADGKKFELVFVSGDRGEEAMFDYMNGEKMEWLAIPFESDARQKLGDKFGVRSIPTLMILDDKGVVITKNARMDVMNKGAAAFDQW